MPLKKQPLKLSEICIENIANNIDNYWLKATNIKETYDQSNKIRFILGPFQVLNDESIAKILTKVHNHDPKDKKAKLDKYHLVLCLHNRLRKLDLSFIRKNILKESKLTRIIGYNCYNVIDLNVSTQVDIKPEDFCTLFRSLTNLKRLNLSYTKVNYKAIRAISEQCKNLEDICLENCVDIDEESIIFLCSNLASKLRTLNLYNVYISEDTIKRILRTCIKLKFLYADGLVDFIDRMAENAVDCIYIYESLESIYVDIAKYLNEQFMISLLTHFPNIRNLHLRSFGSNSILKYLSQFSQLTELIIGNELVITYQFSQNLLDYLKECGKNLKFLHLINIKDVNIRSIVSYCPNLKKLIIELADYYEPAIDNYDNNNNATPLIFAKGLPNLELFELTNSNCTPLRPYTNVEQFKQDILYLLANSINLKHLKLSSLNVIDDEFIVNLISFAQFTHKIETIDFTKLNLINYDSIKTCFIMNADTIKLQKLVLNECKQISNMNYNSIRTHVKRNNYDLKVLWK